MEVHVGISFEPAVVLGLMGIEIVEDAMDGGVAAAPLLLGKKVMGTLPTKPALFLYRRRRSKTGAGGRET